MSSVKCLRFDSLHHQKKLFLFNEFLLKDYSALTTAVSWIQDTEITPTPKLDPSFCSCPSTGLSRYHDEFSVPCYLNEFSALTVLPSQECHVNGIVQYTGFGSDFFQSE